MLQRIFVFIGSRFRAAIGFNGKTLIYRSLKYSQSGVLQTDQSLHLSKLFCFLSLPLQVNEYMTNYWSCTMKP